jgi:hypothetical protein
MVGLPDHEGSPTMLSDLLFAMTPARQRDARRRAEYHRTARSQRRPASPRGGRNPTARPLATTVEELRRKADEFGQLDLGDPGWVQMEAVLDRALRDGVTTSEDRRVAVWEEIIDDPRTPLVVKLRTFSAMLPTLR